MFRNTYAWNVLRPDVINETTWGRYYNIYIRDTLNLDVVNFFRDKNPYALQEMTAVMLETVRKGLWSPDQKTIDELAQLHVELIDQFEAGCSGFVCDNAKLRDFIEHTISDDLKNIYISEIHTILSESPASIAKGMVMKKEIVDVNKAKEMIRDNLSALITLVITILIFVAGIVTGVVKRRRDN